MRPETGNRTNEYISSQTQTNVKTLRKWYVIMWRCLVSTVADRLLLCQRNTFFSCFVCFISVVFFIYSICHCYVKTNLWHTLILGLVRCTNWKFHHRQMMMWRQSKQHHESHKYSNHQQQTKNMKRKSLGYRHFYLLHWNGFGSTKN